MSEMQFGSTDQGNSLVVESQDDGQLCVSVPEDEAHHHLSLQQTIQLRDFLNRHIDSLAFGSIGASAERSSDDPTQLPAEHVVAAEVLLPAACNERTRGTANLLTNYAVGWNEALAEVARLNHVVLTRDYDPENDLAP